MAGFSYAQAAKGLSSSTASKTTSGAATPAKDAAAGAPMLASATSWADDAESESRPAEKQVAGHESRESPPQSNGVQPPSKQTNAQVPLTASNISPPDDISSSSTVTKDDDVASIQNNSSESTWENKSQASTSVDKSAEPAERTSDKVKGKDLEKSTFKPLQDAPIPAVNIWQQRLAKAATVPKQSSAKATPAASSPAVSNGTAPGPNGTANKKSKGTARPEDTDSKEKPQEDEKMSQFRRENRPDNEADKGRKGPKGRPLEKDSKPASVVPPPSVRDQQSWPTPETALDEDRKKAQEKSEKSEKERGQTATARGKHGQWQTMAYTPNVIFNTPLPNTASSRRGGRGGARGGSQGGRGGAYGTAGAEKDASAPSTVPNGEQPRRGRTEGPPSRDVSSAKGKRTPSTGSVSLKDTKASTSGDRSARAGPTTEPEHISGKDVGSAESLGDSQTLGQNSTSRQHPSSRPNKGRKGENLGSSERKKDGELMSPTKDVTTSDRHMSTAAHSEAPEEGERRAPAYHEGQPKHASNERRPYGSFSGRDRARGGRGGNRGYPNGHHQYSNGHTPSVQGSSTFPLRSPTSFHPEQYFQGPTGRGYRGNGPRSQSVTTDNLYGRGPGGYPASAQPLPPIQTYMGGMYEYPPVMQPMSAMPFSPFGVDQFTLFQMVLTQLEYYFSVENLCKDLFLRKHMDSQGFVFLSVIADFNRIKQLTSDVELIKAVCFQSRVIEFRVGNDGKDRLRRRDGWESWVLNVPDRDPSVQNEGPGELHYPPMPHPQGFESSGARYSDSAAGPTNGHMPLPTEPYPHMNGTQPSESHAFGAPNGEHSMNGHIADGSGGPPATNGFTNAEDADSFSNEQVETLSVIVRKQDHAQPPALPPAATRTFSNGSIDSRSGVPDESAKRNSGLKVNGTGPAQGDESKSEDQPPRSLSPFPSQVSVTTPVRLYWVKGKDAPVDSLPPESTYEFYTHLRSKALDQRHSSLPGNCPYDMDVLYQFWSHFLIRNFNTRMYDEFRHFAFEDVEQRSSNVGLRNLVKYYGESLSSTHNVIRERVARHYVDLVRNETEDERPAFYQLRSAWRNGALDLKNRKRVGNYIDPDLRTSLEQ